MTGKFARVLSWLFVLNLGIAFGAGMYEARVVIPKWASIPPSTWPNTGLMFWVYVTTVPLTLLTLASAVVAWRGQGPGRRWWLGAVAIVVVERMATFTYFIPTMVRLMGAEPPIPQAEVETALSQWLLLNHGRHVLTWPRGWPRCRRSHCEGDDSSPEGLVPSIDRLLFALTLFSALGCGLVAGIFFAFSAFVMKALARLPPQEGIAAMQSINVVVLNPWFMVAFLGTAVACILALIAPLLRWHQPDAAYLFVGSALYLVGTLLVTVVFNVPRNESLASVAPADPNGTSRWTVYVASWTAWNHVRTAAALAPAASFSLALAY